MKTTTTTNWSEVSRIQTLSEDFIRKNKDKVDWFCISLYQNLSEEFIREFANEIIWLNLNDNEKISLSVDFKREFKKELSLVEEGDYLSRYFKPDF